LTAAYAYASCACFFAKDSVALHGFSQYYREASKHSMNKATKMMKYMVMRGGNVQFPNINAPIEWNDAESIMETSMEIEKTLYAKYSALFRCAEEAKDHELQDLISSVFLKNQCENIKELADIQRNVSRVGGDGVGLYILDREMASKMNLHPSMERPRVPRRDD
jgi:ferritin